MTIWHFVFALFIGFLCTAIFALRLPRRPASAIIWVFLFIISTAVWIGVLAMGRFGPSFHGVYWLPFLLVGLLALFATAAVTFRNRRWRKEENNDVEFHEPKDG